jgi:hypothetical protein
MSRILKPALLVHMILSVILGVLLLVVPGRFLGWLGWAPIDPIISRVLGAALLALSWGDFRVWRRSTKAEARLFVEVQLGFAVLAAIGVLRHLVTGWWPAIVWIVFGGFGLFALIWLGVLVGERQ